MQASQSLPQPTVNGQYPNGLTGKVFQSNDPLALAALIEAELAEPGPGRTIIQLQLMPRIDSRQALTIGAKACQFLLAGEPHESTFDPVDLELAIVLLQQMAATVQPEGRSADD